MKKLLVVMIVLLSTAAIVNAAETATTVSVDYTSKYMWRGFNLYGSDGAVQPSVNFDLGNGFSANLWASYATSAGHVNATEYDYTLAYSGAALDGEWQTNYTVGWRYYDYIDTQTKGNDLQEIYVVASMPNLVGNNITPHLAYFQMWNARSTTLNTFEGGSIFLMGFGYDFTLDNAPELPMTFTWDIVYNDGVGSGLLDNGNGVDHDWTHMVWGLKTSMECPMGGKIVPAVYFQNTFDSSVHDRDELWANISYSFNF